MSKFETCVDCCKQSPLTESDYTLISARHGWRLMRSKTQGGDLRLEWRCPDCWEAHKQRAGRPAAT